MTSEEFRQTASHRDALREALNIESVQHALAAVKSKNELVSLPLGCSATDAARAHEERRTRALVVAELFEMTTPLPDGPEERPPETFGTKHNVDEFDQSETEKV